MNGNTAYLGISMNKRKTFKERIRTCDDNNIERFSASIAEAEAKAFKVHPTIASKAGINCRAANGGIIKNFGQRQLYGFTNENDEFKMIVQVTDAERNLA